VEVINKSSVHNSYPDYKKVCIHYYLNHQFQHLPQAVNCPIKHTFPTCSSSHHKNGGSDRQQALQLDLVAQSSMPRVCCISFNSLNVAFHTWIFHIQTYITNVAFRFLLRHKKQVKVRKLLTTCALSWQLWWTLLLHCLLRNLEWKQAFKQIRNNFAQRKKKYC